MRTFASVFPHCQLWWNGVDPLMLGSSVPLKVHARVFGALRNVPEFFPSLARISGEAALHTKASLMAALLLTDDAFRAFAQEGHVYTLDRPELEFASGGEPTYRNLVLLLQALSPLESIRSAADPDLMPDAAWQRDFELRRRRLLNTTVRMAGTTR